MLWQPIMSEVFLHGNVMIGVCPTDRTAGIRGEACSICGGSLEPTRLLYPLRQKYYHSDPFIASHWAQLEDALNSGYMLTIFGYGAPATDVDAVELMRKGWGDNPPFELAEVGIIDIRAEEDLRKTWEPFLCRTHYGVSPDIWRTWLFGGAPRRSCESLATATLKIIPGAEIRTRSCALYQSFTRGSHLLWRKKDGVFYRGALSPSRASSRSLQPALCSEM
jgi:hypothetical protein